MSSTHSATSDVKGLESIQSPTPAYRDLLNEITGNEAALRTIRQLGPEAFEDELRVAGIHKTINNAQKVLHKANDTLDIETLPEEDYKVLCRANNKLFAAFSDAVEHERRQGQPDETRQALWESMKEIDRKLKAWKEGEARAGTTNGDSKSKADDSFVGSSTSVSNQLPDPTSLPADSLFSEMDTARTGGGSEPA